MPDAVKRGVARTLNDQGYDAVDTGEPRGVSSDTLDADIAALQAWSHEGGRVPT